MRHLSAIFLIFIWGFHGLHAADSPFAAPEWAFEATFAGAPTSDLIRTPSEQGDSLASRYFYEASGERYMLVRFTYPLAMRPGEELALYDKSITDMMKSRPGQVKVRESYRLGEYAGERLVVAQPREKTTREVRLVVVGSSLYVISGEWPENGPAVARSVAFFNSIKLRSDYLDPRLVVEKERWRLLKVGKVTLRYDAASWYRDPTDKEPGIFNLLRVDQQAEAQLIVEEHPLEGGDIEAAVLKTARDGAESVTVKKSAKKYRGSTQVIDLLFHARVESEIYVNHGYFYSGTHGAVQLRSWATDKIYAGVAIDITELLDGLTIGTAP